MNNKSNKKGKAENHPPPIPPPPPPPPPPQPMSHPEPPQHEGADPSVPLLQDKRRSSVIEAEYMFGSIPLGRPVAHPTPSGKIPSDELRMSVDGESRASKSRAEPKKNVEVTRQNLYDEAVYTCAHYLGTPSPQRFPTGQEEMCLYAHDLFSESQKEQEAVMDHVRHEPFPLTIVNAKVKRAKDLRGPKPNGLVDPYCIVTIETEDSTVMYQLEKREWQQFSTESPIARQTQLKSKSKNFRPQAEARTDQIYENVPAYIKTVVQRRQNNPKWDQRFQCLSLRPSVDKLTVEVWDHSIDDDYIAKSIRDGDPNAKINTNRKTGDIFLGKVQVKVSEIPCDGSDHWIYLSGIPHTKDKKPYGRIRLQLWLVHAYRHGRHFLEVAEPKIILGHLWDSVLNGEKQRYSDPRKWDGSIPSAATCLLFQYAMQNGISEDSHAIIRWNAYAKQDLGAPGLAEFKETIDKVKPDDKGNLPPRLVDSQQEIEDNVMNIMKNDILPIIRNHLREPNDRVHQALMSYQHCVGIVKKYNNPALLQKILWLVHAAIRMCILEWYQHVYSEFVPTRGQVERSQYVSSVNKVMNEVNSLIKLGEAKWSAEFWLTGSIEYLPIIYDELQKMVIHDIEAICWLFFQFFHDYQKLRRILLQNDEKDKNFCNAFFDLYKQTQVFVFAQVDIYKGAVAYPFLENYHRWYRPILILWLGFALIRGSLMICKTIHIDNHVQDDTHTMTSSSALDTATVFQQLVRFWSTLQWPDIPEGYVIINFLMEVMCSYTVLYAELKHAKLNKEGYYDPPGRFTISERLCTALNNIEHVKEQLTLAPKAIDYEHLIIQLEEACGKSEQVIWYEERAKERLEKTIMIVNKHIDDILENVGLRIRKEVSTFVNQSFKLLVDIASNRLNDAMEPVIAYLEDNIVVLQKSLHPQNFHKVLQLLWNLVCMGMHDNAISWEMQSTEGQVEFYKRIMSITPYMQDYFHGGDAGLSTEEMETHQYADMYELLNYFTMSTEDLILMYYHERAQFHLNYKGRAKFGKLNVRISYWNDKLTVEVLSALNLTPHDEELTVFRYFHKMYPTSDPMVEVELKPSAYFSNEKKYTTQVKWKNLNPVFGETFSWQITAEDCLKRSAVILFTVKDYDLLSKNAFLGEAFVPLHVIPGISQTPEQQPMILTLHEVDNENHSLLILKSRKWDAAAKEFTDDQLGKFVESVVSKNKSAYIFKNS